jgi:hypothetical protein
VVLDIAKVTAVSLGLLFYSGWGLTLVILPKRLQRRVAYLLIPVVGLAVVDSIGQTMSFLGLASRHSLLILLTLTTGLNIAAVFFNREQLRLPLQSEVVIILLALPALLLTVSPVLAADQLAPIGTTNGDPVAHATATEFLTDNSYRDEIPLSPEYAIFSSTSDKMNRFVRLGFHYYQSYVDLLTSESAYATYSIISSVGTYLWALTIGFFTSGVLRQSKNTVYLATILFAISALPIWISFGGYGPQSLGMGLLISGFGAWVLALEERDWRHVFLAAILTAGLVSIYSEALVYLILPTAIYAAVIIAFNVSRSWQIVKAGILAMGLSILFNSIGWGRAVLRMVDLRPRIVYGATGNVDWFIDPRQIGGFIPFSRNVNQWYGATISQLLWFPIFLVLAAIIYGFSQLTARPRLIIASFLLPSLATILWFGLRAKPYPYGYFKAWTMGWWVYVILLSVGLSGLSSWLGRYRRTSYAAILLIPLASLLLMTSFKLSLEMRQNIPLNSMIFESVEWVDDLNPEGRLYVSTGDLNRLSTFWLAHLLRDRPTRFSEDLIYTNFGSGTPYHGESFVLRHISSKDDWVEEYWIESIIRENQEFALLTLEPVDGREFILPDPDYPLDILMGDQFRLLGYDTDLLSATTGSELVVTLYWQALAGTDLSYKVFVHLIDEKGQAIAQYDGFPREWTYFTYLWQPGEVVKDEYRLVLDQDLNPGSYKLRVGLYHPDTGERLPIIQNGQPMEDPGALLDTFIIDSDRNPE